MRLCCLTNNATTTHKLSFVAQHRVQVRVGRKSSRNWYNCTLTVLSQPHNRGKRKKERVPPDCCMTIQYCNDRRLWNCSTCSSMFNARSFHYLPTTLDVLRDASDAAGYGDMGRRRSSRSERRLSNTEIQSTATPNMEFQSGKVAAS
jgi:hypothetical protein